MSKLAALHMPRRKQPSADLGASATHGLETAPAACRLDDGQITPLREAVLTALWAAERPLGAYELCAWLKENAGRRFAAPTICRTLDFLCEQGVAAEIENRKVEQLIDDDAKRLGFVVKRRVSEMSGLRAPCEPMS